MLFAGVALMRHAAGCSRVEGCIALLGANGQSTRADERRKKKTPRTFKIRWGTKDA